MKIAIHNRKGSFSDRWVSFCREHGIDYLLVDSYRSDIVSVVKDCDAFMWHHHHGDSRDILFSKQLLYSLEEAGIRCFPNFLTTWFFDDKIGQKYLLESVEAPMVPTHIFYSKKDALDWSENASFPVVFKLRGGAGAYNVKLIQTKRKARMLIRKAFSSGFSSNSRKVAFLESYRRFKEKQQSFFSFIKNAYVIFFHNGLKYKKKEFGYVLFQDFIPGNESDIRVCVIGDKAFAIKRLVRKGDFRASGSGHIVYDKSQIDERCVKIAFEVNEKLKAQSIAFDFVFSENFPLIIEMSYAFTARPYDKCEGYWDKSMNWHAGSNFDFCGWMVDNLLNHP